MKEPVINGETVLIVMDPCADRSLMAIPEPATPYAALPLKVEVELEDRSLELNETVLAAPL